jgi:hypothetical protein
VRLDPFTYLDPVDLVSREEACAALGLDPAAPALLLALGAGNINDISGDVGAVTEYMERHHPDWQVCLPTPVIADRRAPGHSSLKAVHAYPLSRYFAAFDAPVAASGYNSFHELLYLGVPTAFVPNLFTTTDDQRARAVHAERVGAGIHVIQTPAGIREAMARLMDGVVRTGLRERAAELYPGNGAGAGAGAIIALVGLTGTVTGA